MKNQFDLKFDPPAPIGTVSFRDIDTGERSGEIKVILDTGSDVTLLPKAAFERMGMNPVDAPRIELTAFDGTTRRYESIQAQIIFLGKRITGVYFLVDDEIGILGRDVLNNFIILFDGPSLVWDHIDTREGLRNVS